MFLFVLIMYDTVERLNGGHRQTVTANDTRRGDSHPAYAIMVVNRFQYPENGGNASFCRWTSE